MSGEIQGRKVLLCVTGGIAAYKVAYVARELTQLGADVRVVMTRSAQEFVGAQTFAALTNNPVLTELFSAGPDATHVELARGAELAIVAPATANALSKLAHGVADDLFSATMLMVRCPILIAPAMHTEMWEHPATKENVTTLEQRAVTFVGPVVGELSSGDFGTGRMVEPEDIVAACRELLGRSQSLQGRRILVTAGGTQEPIDPVRFIGNRSSGVMGFAIAKAAQERGAKVTLVAGATGPAPPAGVDVVRVRTADEMRVAVLNVAPDVDVIIKAGAVADFKPVQSAPTKLKKAAGPPEINLVP
ncbi:MAG TPA: bifunctional phosphopantothenoylcysteine decarboxylase/phosphopantothenate--cysteine ligase CoaBC, partial [Actinomycetota bacterium]|nr:bifunctional phosphopantothenoylcysteine decarboxylase/phosphopantothenate--cysteine ligase CoaBC [Actinomycetota bacterium]